jgi:hypothetical protein
VSTTWDFESGANGDAISTTNANCDVVLTTGGTATISTLQAHSGTRSMRFVGSTSNGSLQLLKNVGGTSTTLNADFYFYWATLPSAEITLFRVQDSSAGQNWFLNCNGTGRLRLYNSAGTSIWLANAGANALVTGRWYHITLTSTQSATTGTVQVNCVDTTTSTTICDSTVSGTGSVVLASGAQNTGANPFFAFRLGMKAGTSTATGEGFLDDYTFDLGVVNGSVTAVAATCSAAAVAPTLGGDAATTAVAATATAQTSIPAVTGETVTSGGGPATATVQALPPTVTGTANVTAPVATATATAVAPAVTVSATVTTVAAAATAQAYPPAVSASGVGAVTAVAATATGQAIPPTVTAVANVAVTAVRATATGSAAAPTVQYAYTVTAVTSTATATAFAPTVGGSATVTATVASSTGQAVAPAVTTGATITVTVAAATGTARPPTLILAATVTAVRATATAAARAPAVTVYDPTTTPLSRTYVTVAESRTYVITADARALVVAAEHRTVTA